MAVKPHSASENLMPVPALLVCLAFATDVTVQTALGSVRGSRWKNVEAFISVPYAIPPLNERRFASATPLGGKPWAGIKELDATGRDKMPISCWQASAGGNPIFWQAGTAINFTEDCLTLDIWRPAGTIADQKLPVLMFIHGGGFTQGRSGENNGSALAISQQVIVVTVNYRLGPLGFLVLPPTMIGTDHGNGGQNGVNDLIVSLEFLQEHVVSFGGDPTKITVMGESSGGIATCLISISPRAKGLFARAIVQSGPCIGEWGPGDPEYGLQVSLQVLKKAGATTLEEIRALPAANISDWPDSAYIGNQLFPGCFIDGWVLPQSPEVLLMSGFVNPRQLIVGSNTKDGTVQFYPDVCPAWNATPATFSRALGRQYGAAQQLAVETEYPLTVYTWPSGAFLQSVADKRLFCPSRRIAELANAAGTGVWEYTFARGPRHSPDGVARDFLSHWQTGLNLLPPSHVLQTGWGAHATDVWFTFNDSSGTVWLDDENITVPYPFSPGEQRLANTMMDLWGSFARHAGTPAGPVASRLPAGGWPAFVPTRAPDQRSFTLYLDEEVQSKFAYKVRECEFWAAHTFSLPKI